MKIHVGERGIMVLEEVFVPIVLKTPDGSEVSICMRDGSVQVTHKDVSYMFGDNIQLIGAGAESGTVESYNAVPNIGFVNGCFYEPDNTTSMNCKHCQRPKHEHNHGIGINQRT